MPYVESNVLTMEEMARYAYASMVERANDLQNRIIENKAKIKEFGVAALPAWDFYRKSLHATSAHISWAQENTKKIEEDEAVLIGLMAKITWLEQMFAENRRRDDEAWMRDMKAYFSERRK